MKRLIFCGPLGLKNNVVGGGESGNRKTLGILSENNFNICTIEKPYPIKMKYLRTIIYPIQLCLYISHFFLACFFTKNTNAHISGFYGHLIYVEYILVRIAKIFGINTIYEIRAGGAISFYQSGSNIYKYFFKKTIQASDRILCQGKEYQQFLQDEFTKSSIYYPNYIPKSIFESIPYECTEVTEQDTIKLIFFGRIVKSKNIELIVEITSLVKETGIKANLVLIGPFDEAYKVELLELIKNNNLENEVEFQGKKQQSEIYKQLTKSHFFIFPTKEIREGHSNSLTEAMACGVVPIASNYGFNRTVINNSDLIVEQLAAADFAAKIVKICNEKSWSMYSENMRERVKSNFLDIEVASNLLNAYK